MLQREKYSSSQETTVSGFNYAYQLRLNGIGVLLVEVIYKLEIQPLSQTAFPHSSLRILYIQLHKQSTNSFVSKQ